MNQGIAAGSPTVIPTRSQICPDIHARIGIAPIPGAGLRGRGPMDLAGSAPTSTIRFVRARLPSFASPNIACDQACASSAPAPAERVGRGFVRGRGLATVFVEEGAVALFFGHVDTIVISLR